MHGAHQEIHRNGTHHPESASASTTSASSKTTLRGMVAAVAICVISIPGVTDLSLEQLELRQKGSLFEETYGLKVLLRLDLSAAPGRQT